MWTKKYGTRGLHSIPTTWSSTMIPWIITIARKRGGTSMQCAIRRRFSTGGSVVSCGGILPLTNCKGFQDTLGRNTRFLKENESTILPSLSFTIGIPRGGLSMPQPHLQIARAEHEEKWGGWKRSASAWWSPPQSSKANSSKANCQSLHYFWL